MIHNASVLFVYVNYIGNAFGPFTDQLKSNSSAVEIRQIMHGFDLKVTYDSYGDDYQYDHIWRFHHDGQFGSTIVIQGPGEEIDGQHTYHIPFRYDLDISGASADSFQEWIAPGDIAEATMTRVAITRMDDSISETLGKQIIIKEIYHGNN